MKFYMLVEEGSMLVNAVKKCRSKFEKTHGFIDHFQRFLTQSTSVEVGLMS